MIKDDKILTAPLIDVLPGVTRGVIMELCTKIGFQVLEKNIDYISIKELDGLFISGTSPKILPIGRVDDIEFNSANNKIILELMKKYDEIAEEDIKNFG